MAGTCSPEVCEAICRDPVCSGILEDLIPELCFNSVKHGDAKRIEVAVSLADARTVRLLVTDDGGPTVTDAAGGLGTRMLDECATGWTRIAQPHGGTRTDVLLPYAAEVSHA